MKDHRFYIIGLPGAGKTSILNQFQGIRSVDLDHAIIAHYNRLHKTRLSIHELFSKLNLAEFRNYERVQLRSINKDIQLVSCGGGTPCYFDNIDYLLNTGTVLWLQTPIDQIIDRVMKSQRPVPVINMEDSRIQSILMLENLLKKRKSFYERAHYQINEADMVKFLNKELQF